MCSTWAALQVSLAATLLLLAATLGQAEAASEKGQSAEACYSTYLGNGTANVSYTRSAAPRETTFTFLVRIMLIACDNLQCMLKV